MLRRIALKNIAVLTGSTFILPHGCDFETRIVYSNFTGLKKKHLNLIASISEFILPSDMKNFPTPENRLHFIMTMANDCLLKKERKLFEEGFEFFQLSVSSERNERFEKLQINQKQEFILKGLDNNKPEIKMFLNFIKEFSILHFETSENYMKNYLNFEFMPGRYIGKVQV
jgi:hypothetical protein